MSAAAEDADAALLDRVFLTRVTEPGDETAGRWVREHGVREVARRLRGDGPALPGAGERRWAGLRARAEQAEPCRDLAVARAAGVRFVAPGDAEWPGQLDDLGDARPWGCGCGAGPTCGCGRCDRSPWSAPAPARSTGRTWRRASRPGSPSADGWSSPAAPVFFD